MAKKIQIVIKQDNTETHDYLGYKLHQVAPYIGKMRPALARQLILNYSRQGDWVWDPFCGSGTVALECRLSCRNVIASDINPYACALTRAKLHAPKSKEICLSKLEATAQILKNLPDEERDEVPLWVKAFFHERTLKETRILISHFIRRRQYFELGCLLGILHHQRPGFLSYPASHLVPYLRDQLYPPSEYPEAYDYRDPIPRLKAKIERMLNSPLPPRSSKFRVLCKSALEQYLPAGYVNAVITSPPYMDTLDYARDNRLRLWFLGVSDHKTIKNMEIGKASTFEEDMLAALQTIVWVIKPGGACVLVLGDLRRSSMTYDIPVMISCLVRDNIRELSLERQWVECVPDDRRARRNGRATQKETVMVFRRQNGR
jgi:hypothetical protein